MTERQVKDALHRDESELNAIYENIPALMILVDKKRRVYKVNRAIVEFTGKQINKGDCF